MSSWRTSSPDTSGPRAKCDQVVYEAMAKAAEIIVLARCPLPAPLKPASSRFNLFVPEVQDVRVSLQRWRRSLHVPLRLDVYYEHDDRRELLERWCLEYKPSASVHFAAECINPDPIVQLRHVCKKIVIWLRTLYTMSRLLPAHRIYASHKLSYEMNVLEEWQDVPQFKSETLPQVLTPYGPLQYKVWYAPDVRRFLPSTLKTQPIPMQTRNNHIAPPSLTTARSAPANNNAGFDMMIQRQQKQHYSQAISSSNSNPRSPPRRAHSSVAETASPQSQSAASTSSSRPLIHRSNSLEHSTQRPSGLSLALLAEESSSPSLGDKRRAALHHPPPVESSYGYAYNSGNPPTTTMTLAPPSVGGPPPVAASTVAASEPPVKQQLSASPSNVPFLSSTPPALFVGSHNAPLIPPRQQQQQHANMTPPFATLPTALSEPDFAAATGGEEPSSLDLLHSSPFKSAGASLTAGASFSESDVLKHSTIVIPPAEEEEDMPFAVDDEETMEDSAVTLLAHKCATASRLQLFDQATTQQEESSVMVSSLADQLAEFKTFGASLHMSSSNNSHSKTSNEGTSSGTSLISMRS